MSMPLEFPTHSWPDPVLHGRLHDLSRFVRTERVKGIVCPTRDEDIFRALKLTSFQEVRVVILGQDPYPNPKHAMGLAFSVPEGTRPFPLSLRNIDHELQTELGISPAPNGDLTPWANRGVLLLNRALTVGGNGRSHLVHWRRFTNRVIDLLVRESEHPVVFLLWGKRANVMRTRIERVPRHRVLSGAHPVARTGFFGGDYFLGANQFLGDRRVEWRRE